MLRSRILAASTAAILLLGLSVGGAGAANALVPPDVQIGSGGGGQPETAGVKVFVCKYVGTPGVDEEVQTGQNPISVSVNAIPDYQGVGSYFADQHGRSYVLSEDTRTGGGQEGEPDVSECPDPDRPDDEEPTPVTPAADVAQIDCLDEQLVGGVITVDLTVPGVTYSIEDSEGDPVAFDGSTGETAALPAGDYTVFGSDADGADGYDASDFEEQYTIDEYTGECGDLPTFPNWPASVTVTDEACVQLQVAAGAINVVFPVGSDENPNPIRYFIDYEGPDEQELTEESTPVAAGAYVVTAVVTDSHDSVNNSGQTAVFEVVVEGVDPEDCDIDLRTFANWPASVSIADESCGLVDVMSGSISVVFPAGTIENPTPVRYYLAYGQPGEVELTSPTTEVAAGSYVVTAVVTEEGDSVNNSGSSDEFEVVVAAQDADECGELTTLAFTGASDMMTGLGTAAIIIVLAGMGLVVSRRRTEVA